MSEYLIGTVCAVREFVRDRRVAIPAPPRVAPGPRVQFGGGWSRFSRRHILAVNRLAGRRKDRSTRCSYVPAIQGCENRSHVLESEPAPGRGKLASPVDRGSACVARALAPLDLGSETPPGVRTADGDSTPGRFRNQSGSSSSRIPLCPSAPPGGKDLCVGSLKWTGEPCLVTD